MMKRIVAYSVLISVSIFILSAALADNRNGNHVDVISLTGTIDPILVRETKRGIAAAEKDQAQALIIQLDTPGGWTVP